MKTLITILIASFLSVNVIAGNPENHPEKYCAKIKDGVKVIMHQGSILTSEVTLSNGTKIQTDGTIIKTDGSKQMLKEGECIDKDGMIGVEKNKTKK